jgi:hypothetical protein
MDPRGKRSAGIGRFRGLLRALLPVILVLIHPAAAAALFEPTVTVLEIRPSPETGEVAVRFSRPVTPLALRDRLRVIPPVEVDWERSGMDFAAAEVTLRGEFTPGRRHVLLIPEGELLDGARYVKTKSEFVMPERPPRLLWLDERRVVERDSRQLVHLRLTNVENLVAESIRVPALLLPVALAAEGYRTGRGESRALTELSALAVSLADRRDEFPPELRPFLGESAVGRQLFRAAAGSGGETYSLPLTFRGAREKGALELVRAFDNDARSGAASPHRLFAVTDLGITYKRSAGELLLWITSLADGRPRRGVAVAGFAADSRIHFLGTTDGEGLLRYTPRETPGWRLLPGEGGPARGTLRVGEVVLVAAVAEDDAAFVAVDHGREAPAPPGIVLSPPGQAPPAILKGHLFTERGVYRPGDTVHLRGTVREYLERRVVAPRDGAYTLTVTSPRNETVLTLNGRLSDFGTMAADLGVEPFWPRGTYTATLRYGNREGDRASRTFMVQEYRPPRHYTEVTVVPVTRPGSPFVNGPAGTSLAAINIQGLYYAGGPVKHGQVRWKIYHAGTEEPLEGWEGYTAGYPGPRGKDLLESGEAMLDEKGVLTMEFPLDRDVAAGKFGLEVAASVVDFDGTAATGSRRYAPRPRWRVGIGPRPERAGEGETQHLSLVVVDREGRPLEEGEVTAEVFQLRRGYVRKRNPQGDLFWDWQDLWKRVHGGQVAISGGRGSFSFDVAWGGEYLATFTYRDPEGGVSVSGARIEVQWSGWGWSGDDEGRPPYEDLGLRADRAAYRPGETARIALSPRRPVSRYLVTLEREGVLEQRVVDPRGVKEALEIPLEARHAPNVYVSVVGIVPRGSFPLYRERYDDEAPGILFGTLNLPVLQQAGRLTVAVDRGPEGILKAEPGTRVRLDLRVTGEDGAGTAAEVAVGVVNESVLALTGWTTPALEELSRFDAPLAVRTGESRFLLLHQTPYHPVRIDPLTGGGGLDAQEDAASGRVRRDFRPVAFFDPAARTDGQGRLSVSFVLPDTMTTYRVYAVACDRGGRFGHVQEPLLAAREFYLEPGLPRFFTRGDRFTFPVTLFNGGGEAGAAALSLAAAGGLELETDLLRHQVGARDSARATLRGRALRPGTATARFQAEFQGRRDAVELTLPVRGEHVQGSESVLAAVRGRGELRLDLPPSVRNLEPSTLGPGELSCLVTLSGSPFLRLSRALRYLLTYPYGCVEQTSSGVLALAALRGVVAQGLVPDVTPEETDRYLTAGINRLFTMQTPEGGFGYWPGHRQADGWGTLYALAALTQAEAAGVRVPRGNLERALLHLGNLVKGGGRERNLLPMAIYLAARNGSLDAETFQSAHRGIASLPREGRILVLLAGARAGFLEGEGLRREVRETLAASRPGGEEVSFHALHREPALALLLATEAIPGQPETHRAAERLLGGLGSDGIWTSTSDTGWALVALGAYFRGQEFAGSAQRVAVLHRGQEVAAATVEPGGSRTLALDAAAFLADPLVVLETGGPTVLARLEFSFPRVDYAREGHQAGFRVWKTLENADGKPEVRVGDLVQVKVHLETSRQMDRFVALDDPLPAGLVALNSALRTEETPPEPRNREEDEYWSWDPGGYYRFNPSFAEMRDDRVLAFRDYLWEGHWVYSYYARAVCQGEFTLPSTRVQLMYEPDVEGYTPQARFTVHPRP